jgi:hypothetical protein
VTLTNASEGNTLLLRVFKQSNAVYNVIINLGVVVKVFFFRKPFWFVLYVLLHVLYVLCTYFGQMGPNFLENLRICVYIFLYSKIVRDNDYILLNLKPK